MVEIEIPHVYMDVQELAKRWQCGIGVIEMLAETGQIGCCIRPVALEIALTRNWPPEQRPSTPIPKHHHLNQKEIYQLFRYPSTPQVINSHKQNHPELPEIHVQFADIVFFLECIVDFEKKHKIHKHIDFSILATDFSCIIWNGKEYTFGEMQAKVIRQLWQARENGSPWVYGKILLSNIGAGTDRIHNLFGRKPGWQQLIISDKKGKYKLNLPPKSSGALAAHV